MTAALASAVTIAIIALPEVSFRASLDGLRVWWDIVFPALLPFFIASDTLMGLGVVHYIGALLEPLMRPLFNVPGVGAFALAMGLASGYPIGARITARLRREGLCSRVEAERLVSFTNTADPLFMVGAVAVGMFRIPALGAVLALAHYISAILVGLVLKHYGRSEDRRSDTPPPHRREPLLSRAAHELYTARSQDNRSFGQLLGDSVKDSVSTLLLIGGCIMVFSVVVRVLDVFRVTDMIARPIMFLLAPFGVSRDLVQALISGCFEITIGTEMASRAAAPVIPRVVAASAIIAWSGLSVFAQAASMLFGTDVRMGVYFAARVLHAVLAAIVGLGLACYGPWGAKLALTAMPGAHAAPGFFAIMGHSCVYLASIIGVLATATAAVSLAARIEVVTFRVRPKGRH
ncbi:MAG TPA: sporulation integral membrane protein YlbJ [Bacillota bacterium]|nr:sporulation integral membrane protein YlbJ [Bacillota bacterium]